MKILILSTSHPYKTAGIVAKDIFYGFKAANNEVKLLVKIWGNYKDKDIISIDSFVSHYLKWFIRKTTNLLKRFGFFKKRTLKTNRDYSVQDIDQTITYYNTKKILKKSGFTPDVIIILFMPKFLSFKNIYELNQITKAPIFLYLMDMAPMTGGCHYAWNCKAYEKQCGECPALFSDNKLDQSHINWVFKKEFVEKTNITVIAGTEWTFQQLKISSIFKDRQKHKLLLPIDQNVYKPANKKSIRKQLDLPLDKKVIFFGAVSIHEKRKGFKQLIEALNILNKQLSDKDKKNIHLAIAGNGSVGFIKYLPFSYTLLGYLSHTELPKAFQAADVFVSPSIEDSGPMMINQSIMCGTPVVAFEMGIALDLVHTGKTGYRTKLKDSEDLANGIKYILDLKELDNKKMSENCRKIGFELCHPKKQTEKYIKLFNSQIKQNL